jgi:SAM-dependent methyltransferase
VSSLVCCGIANVGAALEEIKRVLRPGGYFVFLERVAAAEGTSTKRWQDRINPIWRIMGCGHINRDTEKAIIAAGFRMRDITRESIRKALPILRPTIRGVAEKPGKRRQADQPEATGGVFS